MRPRLSAYRQLNLTKGIMAQEIGSYTASQAPQLTQALVGQGSTRANGEIRQSGREVSEAENRRQEAEQRVRQAQRNKQQAMERLREARNDEQSAEEQLRQARAQRIEAVNSAQSGLRGTVVNVLV